MHTIAVATRLGGLHSARLLLAGVARSLEAGGAQLLVLATNTMHIVADVIEATVDVPLLHLADATADAVRAASLIRVGLLGTAITMQQPFLRDRLAARGLDVLMPGPRSCWDAPRSSCS